VSVVGEVIVSDGRVSKWSRDRLVIYVPAKTQKKLRKHLGEKLKLIILTVKEGE